MTFADRASHDAGGRQPTPRGAGGRGQRLLRGVLDQRGDGRARQRLDSDSLGPQILLDHLAAHVLVGRVEGGHPLGDVLTRAAVDEVGLLVVVDQDRVLARAEVQPGQSLGARILGQDGRAVVPGAAEHQVAVVVVGQEVVVRPATQHVAALVPVDRPRPGPPESRSAPRPPYISSLPRPPRTVSLPSPPSRRSLPARPATRSSPPWAWIQSRLPVPASRSSPACRRRESRRQPVRRGRGGRRGAGRRPEWSPRRVWHEGGAGPVGNPVAPFR